MDYANLYELQLQSQPHHLLYSSLAPSHGVSSSLNDWNPTSLLDGYEFNRYMNEILPISPSLKSPNWLHQEIRFGDIARSYDQQQDHQGSLDLNQNLSWLMSSNSGASFDRFGVSSYYNNLYGSSSGSLLSSSSSPSNHDLLAVGDHMPMTYRNGLEGSYQSFDQERNSLSYNSPSKNKKTSTFRKETSRIRKINVSGTHEVVAKNKKPRLTSSSSCPTLKVRKEKLGDRIAGLHRLVSPFGKTDTASVLTEAIGYIQFLQNQIQTLSMAYLKSSHKKSGRTIPRDFTMEYIHSQKLDESNIEDLRSKGMCLVPLAYTSYICSFNGSI